MDYQQPIIIEKIGEILREPLPNSTAEIIKQLNSLAPLRYELLMKTAEITVLLYDKRAQYLWPKEKDKTELDRKTFLDAQTGIIEADYILLKEVIDLAKERVQMLKTLLKIHYRGK